jgi:hypothetical protein
MKTAASSTEYGSVWPELHRRILCSVDKPCRAGEHALSYGASLTLLLLMKPPFGSDITQLGGRHDPDLGHPDCRKWPLQVVGPEIQELD